MAQQANVQAIIHALQLEPHPEGGFYRRVYASPDMFADDTGLSRHKLTSIYYLLSGEDISVFHRLDASEMWYYLDGTCGIEIHELSEMGEHTVTVLDPSRHSYLYGVTPETLFAARLTSQSESDYVLVGCGVGPGFEYSRYEMPKRQKILAQFPQHEKLIRSFTASDSWG